MNIMADATQPPEEPLPPGEAAKIYMLGREAGLRAAAKATGLESDAYWRGWYDATAAFTDPPTADEAPPRRRVCTAPRHLGGAR